MTIGAEMFPPFGYSAASVAVDLAAPLAAAHGAPPDPADEIAAENVGGLADRYPTHVDDVERHRS